MQWSPATYQSAAFLAREAEEEMLSRLDWMVIQPKVIVNVGLGAGNLASGLVQRYPEATIHTEEAANLPCKTQSVDLICANFFLPWVSDLMACLKEWQRVLKPNGLLMISFLGIQTLPEWQAHITREHLPNLYDMHDLGDALVAAGFLDPVLDTAKWPVNYRNATAMKQEMLASRILLRDIPEEIILPTSVTYEVVHAHAFTPLTSAGFKADAEGVVRIPLRHLRAGRGES